ncbi:MAG: segregation and condensation protein A [Geminicoccaceae bacterium]
MAAITDSPSAAADSGGFIVDLDGFEGPIDLLLSLAREQKVDLAKISILALAEQYLAYVQQARDLKLELAADYLVMAAWLAYLKSRLLLPEAPGDDEPSGAELAEALAWRLRRLAAIRHVADELLARARLGHERFPRGCPEGLAVRQKSRFRLTLHELLEAYVDQRLRRTEQHLTLVAAPVFRVEDALQRLVRLLGGPEWRNLLAYLPRGLSDERLRRSAIAAHLGACLELARDGVIELNQAAPFGPIYIRRKR